MEKIIKIGLAVVIILLGYFLYDGISGPIQEAKYIDKVYQARLERLKDIRDAQKAYKDVTDSFTNNWDSLVYVLKNGNYKIISQFGDPEDTNSVVTYDTAYRSVLDSMYGGDAGLLDSLRWVPYATDKDGNRVTFNLEAGIAEQNGYKIRVFRVTEPEPYIKEDNQLSVGSMRETSFSGSWE